tara:strand:+ start:3364 stop:3660 length:297 start_codon:yes stop_codon:yes gene_type:complete
MSRKPEVNSTDNKSGLAPSFLQARRELFVILAGFMIFLIWVLLACWILGYENQGEELDTIFGIPDWVALGVALPWLAASVFTFWFCLRRLRGNGGSGD